MEAVELTDPLLLGHPNWVEELELVVKDISFPHHGEDRLPRKAGIHKSRTR